MLFEGALTVQAGRGADSLAVRTTVVSALHHLLLCSSVPTEVLVVGANNEVLVAGALLCGSAEAFGALWVWCRCVVRSFGDECVAVCSRIEA